MLPHNAHLDARGPADLLRALEDKPDSEIDLAASRHFYEVTGRFDWEGVTQAYDSEYAARVTGFSAILGQPIYQGQWDTAGFGEWLPLIEEFANAIRLAVWQRGEQQIYLRYGREDKETPILIALGMEGSLMTGMVYPGQFE